MAEGPDHAEATSERIAADPGTSVSERLIYLLHLASYDFAAGHVLGARVLDLGCGTGYGTARLATRSATIVGVDVSGSAVTAAAARFQAPNMAFQRIEPTETAPLPFDDSSFDVVLSFQVIEHVADPIGYLEEARRVLAGGGVLILATPERGTRLYRGQRPWNRFHLREYSEQRLERLLQRVFGTVEMYGMGGPADLLGPELRRTSRLRLATIPFTFPGAPERWRLFGLDALTRLRALVRSARPGALEGDQGESSSGGAGTGLADALDTKAVRIGAGVSPSVCIVAVAR